MDDFLNPISKYKGKFSPQSSLFDNNLQEFSNQVSIIVGLENNGKLSQIEAYRRIKLLWKSVKKSKKNLIN